MPRKQSYLILAVIVALQCGAMFYWASRKSGFFIDEYYTFEYVQNINDHKDHIEYLINSPMWKVEEWLPVEELKTRYTIEEGESVLDLPLFKSVKKFFFDRNYMWIINALETCFGNGNPPKWICISFNVVVWILFQFLLFYFMSGSLGLDRRTSLLAVTMWGFSPVVMGFAVFCRFYSWTFLLFLSVLVLHKIMWDSTSHKKNLLIVSCVQEFRAYFCPWWGISVLFHYRFDCQKTVCAVPLLFCPGDSRRSLLCLEGDSFVQDAVQSKSLFGKWPLH